MPTVHKGRQLIKWHIELLYSSLAVLLQNYKRRDVLRPELRLHLFMEDKGIWRFGFWFLISIS